MLVGDLSLELILKIRGAALTSRGYPFGGKGYRLCSRKKAEYGTVVNYRAIGMVVGSVGDLIVMIGKCRSAVGIIDLSAAARAVFGYGLCRI